MVVLYPSCMNTKRFAEKLLGCFSSHPFLKTHQICCSVDFGPGNQTGLAFFLSNYMFCIRINYFTNFSTNLFVVCQITIQIYLALNEVLQRISTCFPRFENFGNWKEHAVAMNWRALVPWNLCQIMMSKKYKARQLLFQFRSYFKFEYV